MMRQRLAGRGELHAAMRAQQQRHAQVALHAPDAFTGRGQRHMSTLGARGDGARFLHVEEKTKVGQVESHAASVARSPMAQP
ncbi:hypothetical protein D3C87_2067430 [compost metagenome]